MGESIKMVIERNRGRIRAPSHDHGASGASRGYRCSSQHPNGELAAKPGQRVEHLSPHCERALLRRVLLVAVRSVDLLRDRRSVEVG